MWKIADKFTAGIPDLVGCYEGRFIGIEVKIDPNDLTELQKITFNKAPCFKVVYYPCNHFYQIREGISGDGTTVHTPTEVVDWILRKAFLSTR